MPRHELNEMKTGAVGLIAPMLMNDYHNKNMAGKSLYDLVLTGYMKDGL
jgi:hypothetical protein